MGKYREVFCGIGNNIIRKELLEKTEKFGFEIPALVHESVYISPTVLIEKELWLNQRCLSILIQ